jgi:hypothetical protein
VVDTFTFTITSGSSIETCLVGQLNDPLGKIRIIVAPETDPVDGELVAATYAGATFNPSAFQPRLTLDASNQGLGGGGGSGGGSSFPSLADSELAVIRLGINSVSTFLPTTSTGTLAQPLDAQRVEPFFATGTSEDAMLVSGQLRPSLLPALSTTPAKLVDHFFTLGQGSGRDHTIFSGE